MTSRALRESGASGERCCADGPMSYLMAGTMIERYYALVDENAVDALLRMFAEDAVYQRADALYNGRMEIAHFFTAVRKIRGRHVLDDIYSMRDRVIAFGCFEGFGEAGDARKVGFADFWSFNAAGLVIHRQTYLATGHQIVQS